MIETTRSSDVRISPEDLLERMAPAPLTREGMEAAFTRAFEPLWQETLIVAVVPAYNEDRFIGSVALKARMYADIVIVIDDGSSDQTALVASRAGAEVIAHTTNKGKAHALSTGFARARELGADIVVILDGDGQHDPAFIPAVIHPILHDQADMVIGSRFKGITSKIPAWRQAGQHTLTLLTNLATGVASSDSQSGFRAFSQAALSTLEIRCNGFAIESEMQFWAREQQLRVAEVPITCCYDEGPKRNPVRQAFQVVDGILSLVSQARPLLFFGGTGLLVTMVGTAVWYWILTSYRLTGHLELGYALLATLLIIVGTLTCFQGITLHMLRRMMKRLPEQPTRTGAKNKTRPGPTPRASVQDEIADNVPQE